MHLADLMSIEESAGQNHSRRVSLAGLQVCMHTAVVGSEKAVRKDLKKVLFFTMQTVLDAQSECKKEFPAASHPGLT